MKLNRQRGWMSVFALALIVSACGDSSVDTSFQELDAAIDETSQPEVSGTATESDLEATATESFMAFVNGDHQTYFSLLSEECRDELGFFTVDSHLDGRRFNAEVAGIAVRDLSVNEVTIDSFDGSTAQVSLSIGGTTEDFRESLLHSWIVQDSEWRLADCSDIRPATNDLSVYGTTPDDALEYGFVGEVAGWILTVTWVILDDEATVIEVGGEPAAAGHQLVTANLSLTYQGADPSVTFGDELAFAMINGSNEYGTEASCETDDYGTSRDAGVELAPGDGAVPTICREVPVGDVDGLLLRVTHTASGGERWFELKGN